MTCRCESLWSCPHVNKTLTQPWAQRKHQRGCASSGRLQPRTPSQSKRAPASGNTQTGWPGTGDGRCWPFQRSSSRTSDWQREEEAESPHYTEVTWQWGVCERALSEYLSTSSRATMSPFFRALMANISPVLLYSAKSTCGGDEHFSFFLLDLSTKSYSVHRKFMANIFFFFF